MGVILPVNSDITFNSTAPNTTSLKASNVRLTTFGPLSGTITYTNTAWGGAMFTQELSGQYNQTSLAVSYSGAALANRTIAVPTGANLGRVLANTDLTGLTVALTSPADSNHEPVLKTWITAQGSTTYTTIGDGTSTTYNLPIPTMRFFTTGTGSVTIVGTSTYRVTGEGLTNEVDPNIPNFAVAYTSLNNRQVSSTVDFGAVRPGVRTLPATISSVVNEDTKWTRVMLSQPQQSVTTAGGIGVVLNAGTADYTFGGANDATNSVTRDLTATFTQAGTKTFTAKFTMANGEDTPLVGEAQGRKTLDIACTASVYDFAWPNLALANPGQPNLTGSGTSYTLDFGTLSPGTATASLDLTVLNTLLGTDSNFQDTLGGMFCVCQSVAKQSILAVIEPSPVWATFRWAAARQVSSPSRPNALGQSVATAIFTPMSNNAALGSTALAPITLTLRGTAIAVPEPTTLGLLMIGMVAAGLFVYVTRRRPA